MGCLTLGQPLVLLGLCFFFSSRRRHTRYWRDWSSDVCSSDLPDRWFVSAAPGPFAAHGSRLSDSAIYRWEGSGPWRVIEGPLDSHVYPLATGRGQLFARLGDGTVLQSDDRGEGWSELGERISAIISV